jgi:cation diffusion facilitator family transporter
MNIDQADDRGQPREAPVGRSPLSKAAGSRIEQRALRLSIYGVLVLAVGSIAWGLFIESDVVILNGIFSLFSLIGGGLSLLAARLVAKPEDRRFPYGYSHVEPLVHSVNGMLVLIICAYAFINGVEGIRAGGNAVDAQGVIWFSAVTGLFCLGLGAYEMAVGRRLHSLLLTNDAKSWLLDAAFSAVTLVGFAVLPLLDEPYRSIWARYADPTMVSVLALLLMPVPLGILHRSLREVLVMSGTDDALIGRVEAVLAAVQAEHDVRRAVHHIARSGRTLFIEIDLVVGSAFACQTIAQQDALRERVWTAIGLPLDQAWLSFSLTADPRWV